MSEKILFIKTTHAKQIRLSHSEIYFLDVLLELLGYYMRFPIEGQDTATATHSRIVSHILFRTETFRPGIGNRIGLENAISDNCANSI